MGEAISKIGVISCSGEEIAEGTVARQAVRRVLEALRPQRTVTLCLPLFLAGEEGERRFAREHPTITVDGCSKLCAKRGTEKYSGQVSASLVVAELLGDRAKACHRSTRDADKNDEQAVWLVAERIAAEVDALTASSPAAEASGTAARGRHVLFVRGHFAARQFGDRRPIGYNQRASLDLRAPTKQGPACGRGVGRQAAGNRANLSCH